MSLEEVQRASSHRQDSAIVEEHLGVAEGAPFDVQVVYTLIKNVLLAKYIYTMEPFKNSNASLPQMNQSNTDYSVYFTTFSVICDELLELNRKMFPDSAVAPQMAIKRKKLSQIKKGFC